MKQFLAFLRTTIVGGFLVVLPMILLALLLIETFEIAGAAADLLADPLPVTRIGGVDVSFLLAILLVLVACFSTGLFVGTRLGARFLERLEASVLGRVPGYRVLRNLTRSFATIEESSQFAVAVVNLYGDGTCVLGFIVDEVEGGPVSVFVPNSPAPVSGSVYFVPRERVQRLPVTGAAGVETLLNWGIGSSELIAARPDPD